MPRNSQLFTNHALFGVIHIVLVKILKMIYYDFEYAPMCNVHIIFSR